MTPKRRSFHFPLWALLLAFVPVAVGSLCLRNYLDSRPVTWQEYSEVELQDHLDSGRTVLLFVTVES